MLAEYLVFDEKRVSRLPEHLDWVQASVLPCAGVTAWSAIKGVGIGKRVLIQGRSVYVLSSMRCIHVGGMLALKQHRDGRCFHVCAQAGESSRAEGNHHVFER